MMPPGTDKIHVSAKIADRVHNLLPAMVGQGHGVIVNVSSAATRGIHRIPYSAAKGGINALTASLALEYADAGIRVVATAPGGTEAPPRRISRGGSSLATGEEQTWRTDLRDPLRT